MNTLTENLTPGPILIYVSIEGQEERRIFESALHKNIPGAVIRQFDNPQLLLDTIRKEISRPDMIFFHRPFAEPL